MKTAVRCPAQRAGELFPPPPGSAGAPAPTHRARAGEREAALTAATALAKPVTESTGVPSRGPVSDSPDVRPTHAAPAAAARPAGFAPVLSRRSIAGMLAAALAPATGTALVLPRVVERTATLLAPDRPAAVPVPPVLGLAENPQLLALGAEVGPKLDAYRAAAAALVEARAKALDLWPMVPEEIVLKTNRQRGFFGGCFDLERDLDGKVVWPEQVMVEGTLRLARRPTEVLQAEPLRALLPELQADPDELDDELEADLIALLDIVDGYEAACERARAVLAEANDRCGAAARALCDLAWKARDYPPATIAGVTVHAQVLSAYSEAEPHAGGVAGPGHAGMILGRGLAESVLRVASIAS